MLPPEQDQADRRPLWDALQMCWMDTDPELFLKSAAATCARSKYSLEEIEQIYWNEVWTTVHTNLWSPVGEWAGFELDGLAKLILERNRFGRALPLRILHPDATQWWEKLAAEIARIRTTPGG